MLPRNEKLCGTCSRNLAKSQTPYEQFALTDSSPKDCGLCVGRCVDERDELPPIVDHSCIFIRRCGRIDYLTHAVFYAAPGLKIPILVFGRDSFASDIGGAREEVIVFIGIRQERREDRRLEQTIVDRNCRTTKEAELGKAYRSANRLRSRFSGFLARRDS